MSSLVRLADWDLTHFVAEGGEMCRVGKQLLKRQEQRKRELKQTGINYDFGMVA